MRKQFFKKLLYYGYRKLKGNLDYIRNCRSCTHIRKKDVVETLSHEPAFTEGFFFHDGTLYESSGLRDRSFLFRYSDGFRKPVPEVFLEGCVILHDRMYLLTYKNRVAFVLDKDTFEITGRFPYEREGWGLTTDGTHLIASDGSDRIYYMDTEYQTVKTISVRDRKGPVRHINELQYIEGIIFANVWQTNIILAIDASTGEVIRKYYIRLKSKGIRFPNLNGIAYDGEYLYLTGKYYKDIWKIRTDRFLNRSGQK